MVSARCNLQPKPEAFAVVAGSRDWCWPGNLLTAENSGKKLVARAAHLPNFIADELVKCSFSSADSAAWTGTASVLSEVSFKGSGETRKNMIVNGVPTADTATANGCIGFGGGFGPFLKPLFDPECRTWLDFVKKIGKNGNKALVYNFSSPPEGCFGAVFAAVDRVTARSVKFPAADAIGQIEKKVTWDFIQIGGSGRVTAKYVSHRHFEADSSVTFQP